MAFVEILFSYNPHVEELCQLPRTRTDTARDSEYGHCSRERGPQRDCFDGVPLNRDLVPVLTLDDGKSVGLSLLCSTHTISTLAVTNIAQ
ncbi:hypothetical protein GCM10008994_23130 [Halorubrum ejinorense]|uniref:Uncharacterized protein n=1 Tax=Halorubrum ejinorense TaxID=425309 RepID=A0AAV3STY2_9EURY